MSSDTPSTPLTNAWIRSSNYVLDSVLAANRATLAAFGGPSTDNVVAGEERPEWDVKITEHRREGLSVGDSVRFSKRLTDDDVRSFAETSGDTNRLHLDDEFAGETRFGGRIVHGTLVSGLISAALARLPGLVIYLSQDVEFHNPVEIGERATADCEIVEDLGDYRYRLRTTVTTEDGSTVIDGEAVILLDEA